MGIVGSVRVKAAGKSKEFRLISMGATDSRLKSEQSDCMEVHVSDDVSQRINVMFICSEWESSKGGLSTFNREFAVNLAKESSEQIKVHCYVCKSSEEDRKDASKHGVNLITARPLPGCNRELTNRRLLHDAAVRLREMLTAHAFLSTCQLRAKGDDVGESDLPAS